MRKLNLTAAAGVCLGVAVLVAPAALADGNGGSVNGTVSIALRSVTVDLASANFTSCYDSAWAWHDDVVAHGSDAAGPETSLTIPNGFCASPAITVTNGPVPGQIFIEQGDGTPGSANAVGTDGTGTWTFDDGPTLFGFDEDGHRAGYQAAQDHYAVSVERIAPDPDNPGAFLHRGYAVTPAPACDSDFDVTADGVGAAGMACQEPAGKSSTAVLGLSGPGSLGATDTATSYAFTTTWLAVPSQ